MRIFQSLIGFLGRLCISAIFIAAGVRMLLDFQGSEHYYVATLCDWLSMAMGNEPLQDVIEMGINRSFLFVSGAIFCAIGGGLLVLLGLSVRLGAFLLLVFLIPVTVLFHHFWNLQGSERQTEFCIFMRNISVIGGLLILLAYGKGGCKKPKNKEKDAKEK